MKKLSIFFYTFFIVLLTESFAIPIDPCNTKKICCEDISEDSFAFSYPKDVGLSCPRNFYLNADFLLMKPTEKGLEYAIEQNNNDITAFHTFPLQEGFMHGFSSRSQEWDWRPGFRVGMGFYLKPDVWNIETSWTYLRIKADSAVDNSGTGTLLGLFFPVAAPTDLYFLNNASARWSGDLNTFDIMFGKSYHISRFYVCNPMFGIRSAWIDQDYHVRYYINNIAKDNVYLKNDYWAVGLRGYYDANFLLGKGWHIFAKAAFALLFGKFDISQFSSVNVLFNSLRYKLENSFYCMQPNAELQLGFCKSIYLNKDHCFFTLKLAYEFQHWWNQNQARKFFDRDPVANDITSRGDLSFNGFVFSMRFEL